jgi:hypothetical protein
MVEARHLETLPDGHPVTHVLAPFNVFNPAAAATFEKAKATNRTTVRHVAVRARLEDGRDGPRGGRGQGGCR